MEEQMLYAISSILGLLMGIFLFYFWKKLFYRYLPLEDATLLKIAGFFVFSIGGTLSGFLISFKNKYTILIGVVLIALVVFISCCLGLYYKVIATKKINY